MIKTTDYIHCYENILSKELCQDIIDNSKNLDFYEAVTLRESARHMRKCYWRDLDKKFEKNIYNAVAEILQKYKKDHEMFSTGLSTEDTGYEHLIYFGEKSGQYKEHVDHMDSEPRVLSCSFILNDNFKGGEFAFFKGQYKISPKTGSVVVFPSNFCFPHAITPVSNGDRHAIITWIR